ncbi:hypothetical protein VTN49DRAFT_4308 [Thermomyces lanuginosus]|uniref:uncharacterized protein n=1 Tax=Thermomyces lanuginosus TaxID=5541 RepID=UPI003742D7D1
MASCTAEDGSGKTLPGSPGTRRRQPDTSGTRLEANRCSCTRTPASPVQASAQETGCGRRLSRTFLRGLFLVANFGLLTSPSTVSLLDRVAGCLITRSRSDTLRFPLGVLYPERSSALVKLLIRLRDFFVAWKHL